MPLKTGHDVVAFSEQVAAQYGLAWEEDEFLTGDSMLIQPAVLERVGVLDPRYYGYFGDIDYGLRVQRAGLKLVCAKGAWLLHEGAAFYKNEVVGKDVDPVRKARMTVVKDAYAVFRQKWNPSLPAKYPGSTKIDFAGLRSVASPAEGEFQPRIFPGPEICEIL
jgi:hypothetical protein